VEFSCRNDLGQLFHVRRLDVDNVEALVLNVEIPQIDPEIIAADEGLAIAVDRDAVDMVGMRISISLSRNSGDHGVVMSQPGELEVRG
jgi:hypothetical protein